MRYLIIAALACVSAFGQASFNSDTIAIVPAGSEPSGSCSGNGGIKTYAGALYVCDTTWKRVFIAGSDIQCSGNTCTVGPNVLLKSELQSGAPLACNGSASATAQTCTMSPTLTAYTSGMTIPWKSGATNSSGAITLNIDTLGAKSLKKIDGTTDPDTNSLVSGRAYLLWYDGTVWRVIAGLESSGATTMTSKRLNPFQDMAAGLTLQNGTAGGNLNRVYVVKMRLTVPQTITTAIGRVTTLGTGSFGCAIYSGAFSKLAECPKFSTGSVAGVSGSLTASPTLAANTDYYFASSIDNNTAQISNVSVQGIHYLVQTQDLGYCTETADFTQSAGSIFPSGCTWNDQTTTTNIPLFILR